MTALLGTGAGGTVFRTFDSLYVPVHWCNVFLASFRIPLK